MPSRARPVVSAPGPVVSAGCSKSPVQRPLTTIQEEEEENIYEEVVNIYEVSYQSLIV